MRYPLLLACALVTALMVAGAPRAPTAQDDPPSKKVEPKRVTLSFENQSWKKVLEWLSEQSNLPLVSTQSLPAGTFTFVSPPGRTYTIPEVIDLVNEALTTVKYRVQRGPASLLLLPADERIDSALVPTVTPVEMLAHGRTEVVRVVLPLKALQAKDLLPEVKRLLGPFGEVNALANRLVLQDTVQNLKLLLKILQDLEAQSAAGSPPGSEKAILKAYAVPSGTAEAVTTVLQEMYRNVPAVKITATGNQQVLVWGPEEVHLVVARSLQGTPPTVTEVIPLGTLPAARTVETLRAMFGRTGGPYLEADGNLNLIVIRGTREQIQEIKAALAALGEAPAARTTRVITVERGSALAVAEALEKLIRQMRPNPVRVIAAGQKSDPAPKVPAKDGGPAAKDPIKPPPPLTLTVVGNKLIAACEDAEVLALVQELLRLCTQPDGEGDFEIITLRFADAVAVAKVLDEAFNGPAGAKGPQRVRVVADSATNALLIKATPLDLLTIRQLLRNGLDTDREKGEVETRTWIIGPLKNANAAELVKLVQEVYREEARRPSFALGSDLRTNSLVLRCSEALFRDIQSLVQQLDAQAPGKPK